MNSTHAIFVGGNGNYDDTWLFDKDLNTWTQLPDMPQYKYNPMAGMVRQTDLVVTGGFDNHTYILSLETMVWRPGILMTSYLKRVGVK